MYNLFTVDPSLRACGWAKFEFDDRKKVGRYLDSGVVKSKGIEEGEDPVIRSLKGKRSKANDWVSRLDETVDKVLLDDIIYGENGETCLNKVALIELPSTYSGGKGDVAAASGAIMKLMGVVFSFRERLLHEHYFEDVILVPVATWKGQVKKEITQRRVDRNWKIPDITDHNEYDAIAIGDWYLRRFLKYKPIR